MSAPPVGSKRAQSDHGRRTSRTGRGDAPDLVVGVDTGGTFTDIVYRDGERAGAFKLLSTPDDPGRAVVEGLERLFGTRRPLRLTYGTTVATNAMLERRGARTVLVTTAGFEDVIEIGRQARPRLYDLEPTRVPPLVARARRIGVTERVLYDGRVEQPLDADRLDELRSRTSAARAESVAVCLLHAHVNPRHERAIAAALASLGVPISCSHELSPAPGEYERTSTTVVNAYVRPLVARHLSDLSRSTGAKTFRVMQSNGGAIGVDIACREPIRTMLSGPAGGVSAALVRCREVGIERAITLDMGGTSTDVALLDGDVPRRTESDLGELPVRTPCVDIHTVGAGGGSIASLDVGGSLKVGPESAGADPGPACYGRGLQPTVTDANAVLGRLRAESFLGGAMALDVERSRRALAKLARDMKAASIEEAAEGVVRVVEGTMERAIRVITVERGQDPRTCVLVAFGGAAGVHACGLADSLGIPEIVVPTDPGLLSAWGVIDGRVIRDRTAALDRIDPSFSELERDARRLVDAARRDVRDEGVDANDIAAHALVSVRYLGQSIQLEVDLKPQFRKAFDREHRRLFHTADPTRSIEVTALRATATGRERPLARSRHRARPPSARPRPRARANVFIAGRRRPTALHERSELEPGAAIAGPAIIAEYSSTVLVAPGWRAIVDAVGNLRIKRTQRNR